MGSAIQISLFMIPLMIIAAWFGGQPLSYDFHAYEAILGILAVILVAFLLSDGKAHWLKGLILTVVYITVAATYLIHVDDLAL